MTSVKDIVLRLKNRELTPWFIQANVNNFSLYQDRVLERDEHYDLMRIIENGKYKTIVKELWSKEYEIAKNTIIPQEVLSAFEGGLEEYSCDNLCSDYEFGVNDYDYDKVINKYIKDVGEEEALFALYAKYYLDK